MELRNCGRLRLAASLLFVLALPLWLGGCVLEYTGDLFTSSKVPELCLKATDDGDPISSESYFFTLSTIWGRTIMTPSFYSNVAGEICLRKTLPADIYKVEPTADYNPGYYDVIPSVLTIYTSDWAGVFAGGRIEIPERPPVPNACRTPVRSATFGIINRTIEEKPVVMAGGHPAVLSSGKPARLLYLDPLNRHGAVEVSAQDFELRLVFGGPGVGIERIREVHLTGSARFISNGSSALSSYFEATLAKGDSWNDPSFDIAVFQSGVLVYLASGKIADGGVVLKCTGGHGGS